MWAQLFFLLLGLAVKGNVGAGLQIDPACKNCERLEPNYYDEYYPDNSTVISDGVCTWTGHRFATQCWLNFYNEIYDPDTAIAPDSNCPVDCTCDSCPQFFPNYNPICISTGSGIITVENPCELQCMQCDNPNVQVIKCGPCDTPCSDIEHRLNCLSPVKQNCIVKPDAPFNPGTSTPCICTLEFSPVCGIDSVTKNMKTFGNRCEFNCAKASNPNLHLLYNNGIGECFCNP